MPAGNIIYTANYDFSGARYTIVNAEVRNWTHVGFWGMPVGGHFYGYKETRLDTVSNPVYRNAPYNNRIGIYNIDIVLAIAEELRIGNRHFTYELERDILVTAIKHTLTIYVSLHKCPAGETPGLTGAYELNSDVTLLDNIYHRVALTGYWN